MPEKNNDKDIFKKLDIECATCKDKIEIMLYKRGSKAIDCQVRNTIVSLTTSMKPEEILKLKTLIAREDWIDFKNTFRNLPNFICNDCESPYCKKCWKDIVTHYEDQYDIYITATCPKGHHCFIDQVI